MVRREADKHGGIAVFLTPELTDIELAALAHVRRTGIAEMGVMLPDRKLCAATFPNEMRDQGIKRLSHVPVAKVP
jgi:hypothetical protein